MRVLNWTRRFSRRGFLAGSAATVAAVAATGGTVLEEAHAVPVEDGQAAQTERARTLVKFARDLFPHDRLDDSFYEKAIMPLQAEAAKDPSTRRLLYSGTDQLNRLAMEASGKPYADVPDENTESGAFFKKVYDDTIVGLYNQPEVWPKFGYEGPSSAKGGYLHRGFSDISWLPKS